MTARSVTSLLDEYIAAHRVRVSLERLLAAIGEARTAVVDTAVLSQLVAMERTSAKLLDRASFEETGAFVAVRAQPAMGSRRVTRLAGKARP